MTEKNTLKKADEKTMQKLERRKKKYLKLAGIIRSGSTGIVEYSNCFKFVNF